MGISITWSWNSGFSYEFHCGIVDVINAIRALLSGRSCVDYSETITILIKGSPVSTSLKDVQPGMLIMTLEDFATPVYSPVMLVSNHPENIAVLELTIAIPAGSVYEHRLVPYHHLWTFRGSAPLSVPASQIVVGDSLIVFADKQCHLAKVMAKNVVVVKGVANVWTSSGSFLANSVLTSSHVENDGGVVLDWIMKLLFAIDKSLLAKIYELSVYLRELFCLLIKFISEMWGQTMKALDDLCHTITSGAKRTYTEFGETLKKTRATKGSYKGS